MLELEGAPADRLPLTSGGQTTPRVSQQACARDALGPSILESCHRWPPGPQSPQHTRSPGLDRPCVGRGRGGCVEGRREGPSEMLQGEGARGLGKATSGLPRRSQVARESEVGPGAVSAGPAPVPRAQSGAGAREPSLRHQGDERKCEGNRPDDGPQDRVGAVTQRAGEGRVVASTSWAAS